VLQSSFSETVVPLIVIAPEVLHDGSTARAMPCVVTMAGTRIPDTMSATLADLVTIRDILPPINRSLIYLSSVGTRMLSVLAPSFDGQVTLNLKGLLSV
jgi:hypothetical protein